MADRPFLPYGRQTIDEDDIAAVTQVLRGDYLTTGPNSASFDQVLAQSTGARHAIGCANGTAALHLAALALDLGPGDCVVVPAITFTATANAARFVGAEVEFADVDPLTGLMRVDDARAAIARAQAKGWKVRALFPVHLAGQVCDMAGLAELARDHDLAVVEDACHALGGVFDGHRVGDCAFSALSVFSFHPVKTVAMGEGGAVTTNDDALAGRLRDLRSHGITRDPTRFQRPDLAFDEHGQPNSWHYEMLDLGFNYRLSDIACALGLSQLAKLPAFVARRAQLVARYDRLLAPLAPLLFPTNRRPRQNPGWHLYVALVDFPGLGRSRAQVMESLRTRGIGTQVHYIPVPDQPYYVARYGRPILPGAQAYFLKCLSLPLYPGLGDDDQDRVIDALFQELRP
ncbi:MAG: UDP-4-amino-4,6-dideoxy-N-acetyl-beta-L-altrosamine transaminase [Magnetospirillum sp.]|nr:UDP-4-amino-4,6-dideoxy-N-acetyl-beta-L-altrosamine transaminase [Magnetospirillum sp.]